MDDQTLIVYDASNGEPINFSYSAERDTVVMLTPELEAVELRWSDLTATMQALARLSIRAGN